ncbi:MAG: hypothetical protein WC721_22095 [Victivallaceae bacterium]|jgi:DNA-binding transcriptional MocR family regulator
MEDKIISARNYILDLLESSKLKGGDKLPGIRVIASSIKISFVKTQQALDKLVQDGIQAWVECFEELLAGRIPHLRLCRKFPQSVFELYTTINVQNNRNNYIDLQQVLDHIYPDKSLFFSHPFKNFYVDRKLVVIPFIFSPRVMFYNPKLLKKYGCSEVCWF